MLLTDVVQMRLAICWQHLPNKILVRSLCQAAPQSSQQTSCRLFFKKAAQKAALSPDACTNRHTRAHASE